MGFKFKVGENKFTALDEKKWYPVRLLSVEEDTVEWDNKPVAKFKFSFVILDPEEFEGREIGGMVNQPTGGELNERHTLFAWLTALRGGVPPIIGDEIDFPDQLQNKIVMAQVKSVKKNYQGREMVFQNVNKLAVCPNATDYALRASDKTGAGGPQTQTAAGDYTRRCGPAHGEPIGSGEHAADHTRRAHHGRLHDVQSGRRSDRRSVLIFRVCSPP